MKTNNKNLIFLISVFFISGILGSLHAGEIHTAAKNGNLDKVRELISSNPQLLNEKDNKGNTPLHSAVSKGRNDVIDYLLNKGANPEIKNNNGLTPIFQALDLSRSGSVNKLIDCGANINVKGYRNRTLLHMAARSGNSSVTIKLIAKGIEINALDSKGSTALDCAILSSKTKTAKILAEKGGKINSFTPDNVDCAGVLKRAIHTGQSEIFALISDLNGDFSLTDESGRNLLHSAAAYGYKDILNILLKSDIDINSKTRDNKTALQLAEIYGHKDVIELLKSRGANISSSYPAKKNTESILKESLTDKEAHIWYLDHSAWAVKTKNNLLIFDYTENGKKPSFSSLGSGYVNPSELKDLKITVFSSHGHNDHYDNIIFNWKRSNANIQYVLGSKPGRVNAADYTFLGAGQSKTINGIEVKTIKSTDAGVAFLIKADGLDIYFAGDHANTQNTKAGPYHQEIDYLSTINPQIDIAFVLAGAGCGGGYESCVLEGDFYAINKLSPKVVFPMHSGGKEYVYDQFKIDAASANISSQIIAANFRGDHYFYEDGIIKE